MKKIILGILFVSGISSYLSAQLQVIDLSTGVTNGGGTMSAGTNEDTWTAVIRPDGVTVTPKALNPHSLWGINSCGKWIGPYYNTSFYPVAGALTGVYEYKTTFIADQCNITSACFNFTAVGADEYITELIINGNSYSMSGGFSPLSSVNFCINPQHIVTGTNNLSIKVQNDQTFTGLMLCGSLSINHNPMVPAITGNTSFCSNNPLTFTGTDGAGLAFNHYWEILEWDNVNGVPAPGGFVWSTWVTGTPGSFTFPAGINAPCNKYYKIKLAVANSCVGWSEASQIIRINCAPIADAGPDQGYCMPGCFTVGNGGRTPANVTYTWSPPGLPVSGNPQQAVMCPTATTTYTVTATNTVTGCSSTDVVTIFIYDCISLPTENNGEKTENESPTYTRSMDINPTGDQIQIYPNPSTGKFILEFDGEITGNIDVYNLLGSMIQSVQRENNNTRYEIDLTDYPNGIYVVNLILNGEQITRKVFLNK